MEVREYTAEDYPTLCEWWKGHSNEEMVPEKFIPSWGRVVTLGGEEIAAMFAYLPPEPICMLTLPFTKIGVSPKLIRKALTAIIESLQKALIKGAVIITFPKSRGLEKLYEDCGFMNVSKYSKEMLWGNS